MLSGKTPTHVYVTLLEGFEIQAEPEIPIHDCQQDERRAVDDQLADADRPPLPPLQDLARLLLDHGTESVEKQISTARARWHCCR